MPTATPVGGRSTNAPFASDYDVLLDEHLTVADLKTLIAEETGETRWRRES